MAGQTRRGQQASKANELGLPQSSKALRDKLVVVLTIYREFEATAWIDQKAQAKEGDDAYTTLDGGPMLTFDQYRQELQARERRLKDATPPEVWRSVLKHIKDVDKAVAA